MSRPTLSFMVNKNVIWSTRAIFGTETSGTASLSLPLMDCCKGYMIFVHIFMFIKIYMHVFSRPTSFKSTALGPIAVLGQTWGNSPC